MLDIDDSFEIFEKLLCNVSKLFFTFLPSYSLDDITNAIFDDKIQDK